MAVSASSMPRFAHAGGSIVGFAETTASACPGVGCGLFCLGFRDRRRDGLLNGLHDRRLGRQVVDRRFEQADVDRRLAFEVPARSCDPRQRRHRHGHQ
jgi:hypothetical protein